MKIYSRWPFRVESKRKAVKIKEGRAVWWAMNKDAWRKTKRACEEHRRWQVWKLPLLMKRKTHFNHTYLRTNHRWTYISILDSHIIQLHYTLCFIYEECIWIKQQKKENFNELNSLYWTKWSVENIDLDDNNWMGKGVGEKIRLWESFQLLSSAEDIKGAHWLFFVLCFVCEIFIVDVSYQIEMAG